MGKKRKRGKPETPVQQTDGEVMATLVKDKNGKTVFDGRDLYRKKTKKEV